MKVITPKRLLITGLVSAAGAGLRFWIRTRSKGNHSGEAHPPVSTDDTGRVTERFLLYLIVPLWVTAGSLDYVWHRRTKIETTSGTMESVIHALMMTEAGLPLGLGLVFEVNAGVILLMIAGFFVHAATAIWDVSFAVERRKVLPNEQHIHSFLEVLPFCAVAFVACLHWSQFASLFGIGNEKPRFGLNKKNPPLPKGYLLAFLGAVSINGAAYGEELIRCWRAQQEGRTGVDTPKAARELYASS